MYGSATDFCQQPFINELPVPALGEHCRRILRSRKCGLCSQCFCVLHWALPRATQQSFSAVATDLVQGSWAWGCPNVGMGGVEYPDTERVQIQAKSTVKHVCVLGAVGGVNTTEWSYWDFLKTLWHFLYSFSSLKGYILRTNKVMSNWWEFQASCSCSWF